MTRKEKIKDIVQDTDKNYDAYYHVLPKLIKDRNYKYGIEIGVFCGGHADKLLNEQNLRLLIGIDPYQSYNPGMPRLDNQEDFDELHNYVMDRLSDNRYLHIRDTSDNAFDVLYRNGFMYDFVFIDGLHTYDQLKKDLNNYDKIIKDGGVIACHDYNHSAFPLLTKAIDEFVREHNAKLVIGPLHLVYMNKNW